METPAPEFCFLWIDHWSTCMTKGEWSGWMQAIFSVLAIAAAIGVSARERHLTARDARARSRVLAKVAASSVLLTMTHTDQCLDFVSDHIEVFLGTAEFDAEEQLVLLNELRHPTSFEQAALLEWSGACGTELALGKALVDETKVILKRAIKWRDNVGTFDEETVDEILAVVARARQHYERAVTLLLPIAE